MAMRELKTDLQVDFDLPQEQVESFQNIMFERGYKVGFASITGTGFVHQFREPMMCAMVKPSYRWITHHGPFIDLNKNQCIQDFLDTDLTHLLFIDHDTVPRDRLCLAKLLLAEKDVISGIQAFKTFPTLWSVGYRRNKKSKKLDIEWYNGIDTSPDPVYDPWGFKPEVKNKIQKVIVCGGGFLLVKRDVFDKIEFPWFGTSVLGGRESWKFQGEDFWFAGRCFEAKIPIYVHWGVMTEHMDGRRAYPLRFTKGEDGVIEQL